MTYEQVLEVFPDLKYDLGRSDFDFLRNKSDAPWICWRIMMTLNIGHPTPMWKVGKKTFSCFITEDEDIANRLATILELDRCR